MEESRKIRKAIIPVAGLGTRMLPATKAVPKELLPILDKPLIQHIIEEAVSAGIEEIILITRSGKEAIENHLDANFELELLLKKSNKKGIISKFPQRILKDISILSIRQENPLGLGHAIFCAKPALEKGEPFAVFLPDEFLLSLEKEIDFYKMMKNYSLTGNGQILVEKISKKDVSDYGIVDLLDNKLSKGKTKIIKDFIEKPSINSAPSNLRIVGRYILPYEIIDILKGLKPGKNKEIQLTDALKKLLKLRKIKFEAVLSNSRIFDCGSLKGFLGANIASASKDKNMRRYLKEILT
tara:strand:- start:8559 stop:9449 length:891 start_codon:yes stop_codon:yes gene_type:complete